MINKIVRIISDNEMYTEFLNRDLIITERYFQEDRDEEPIYDLELVDSESVFPFSLYKWEFEEV